MDSIRSLKAKDKQMFKNAAPHMLSEIPGSWGTSGNGSTQFFCEFWHVLKGPVVPEESYPSLCSSGFTLHGEDVPGWCDTISTKLSSLQLVAHSQVQPPQVLSAATEVVATYILPTRQPVLNSTEDENSGGAVYESGTEGHGLFCPPWVHKNAWDKSLGVDKGHLEPTDWLFH